MVLRDGTCVLCSGSFRFFARRDVKNRFKFAVIQSPYGREAAQVMGIDPDDPDTFAVVLRQQVRVRSDGALAMLRHLPGWQWTFALRMFPSVLRDAVYTLVARNRYHLFGRSDTCMVPSPELAHHMIRS